MVSSYPFDGSRLSTYIIYWYILSVIGELHTLGHMYARCRLRILRWDASGMFGHFSTWRCHVFVHYFLHISVNYNSSLTWIKAIWRWFRLLTMIPVRSRWGRYNFPRHMYTLFFSNYILHFCGFPHLFHHMKILMFGRSWIFKPMFPRYILVYIYIWSGLPPARSPPPPKGMGLQVAPPLWQHFWGPASYFLGFCSDSDYQPPIY